MHIILGGTGHVGKATTFSLLAQDEPVTVVTREASRADDLERAGARVAVADVRDVEALRGVFRTGQRAFLLNPPADPTGDTDAEERASVGAIVAALDGSKLEKVVAQSTYGARPGEPAGDLTVLHEFEERLRAQSVPAAINRGAYYMSNWAGMLETVRESGVLPSFFPADLALPMVAAGDLGEFAARRLLSAVSDTGVRHVEGPARYTPAEVADAFETALGRAVQVDTIAREDWEMTFEKLGFSQAAARSYARMTAAVVDEPFEPANEPERGATTLEAYIRDIARTAGHRFKPNDQA